MVDGWWRRNVWGLVLLPVAVVAALIGPFVDTAYRDLFRSEPRIAIDGPGGAWATFAGGRMRLLKLETVPSFTVNGARVWHALVGYDASTLGGCTVVLEDGDGRTFGADPVELSGANLDGDLGCGAPSDGATRYELSYYFVLPAGARAAALRITVPTETPRYARLTPPP
jgi:hypothetical protein